MVDHVATHLDHVFRALGDPTRRAMLRTLARGDRTVTELASPFRMTLAGASKHVRVLEKAGLVRRTIEGRTHTVRLAPRPLSEARRWLEQYERFWMERLDALDRELRGTSTTSPARRKR